MSDPQPPTDPVPDERVPPPPSGWRALRETHPRLLVAFAVAMLLTGSVTIWVARQRDRYRNEIVRLRSSMTEIERERADEIVTHENNKLELAIALFRRQAQVEPTLHLAISVDTGAMYLEREGALLREMPVQIGLERRVGLPPDTVRLAAPRGVRTISRILSDTSVWDVPAWVYEDRGMARDSSHHIAGALGPVAIELDGGTFVYSLPQSGPLSDSLYVLPGAVRARAADLRAILPNLTPGMRVYFY